MAVPAGVLLLSALVSAGAQGYSASQSAKAGEDVAAGDRAYRYKALGEQSRQHREEMRLKRKQQKSQDQMSALNMLAGVEGLKQQRGMSSADYLSALARG